MTTISSFFVVGLGKDKRQFHHFSEDDEAVLKLEKEPSNIYDKK